MSTANDLVNSVLGNEPELETEEEEIDMEVADTLARNMIEGMQRKKVSNTDAVGSYVLAAVITMLEDGLDDHDIYATIVTMTGEMLREPEETNPDE